MKRWLTTSAVLAGWVALGAHSAMAQQPYMQPPTNPYPTQGLNPYLNLIPNNPYIQYFGLGQGQANNARTLQQLQQQINQQGGLLPLGVANQGLAPVMITGHPVSFQNTTHYFPTPGQPFAGMGGGMGAGYAGGGGYGAGAGGGFGTAGFGGGGGFGGGYTQPPVGYGGQVPR